MKTLPEVDRIAAQALGIAQGLMNGFGNMPKERGAFGKNPIWPPSKAHSFKIGQI